MSDFTVRADKSGFTTSVDFECFTVTGDGHWQSDYEAFDNYADAVECAKRFVLTGWYDQVILNGYHRSVDDVQLHYWTVKLDHPALADYNARLASLG